MSDKYCVLQDDLKDCGICSLLSIIKYYHGDVSKEYLRELTKTSKAGVNAINILRTARELGFEAYGMKGKIKDLKSNLLPLIAHLKIDQKYYHFVVVYKIDVKKDKILVMDPARGYLLITFSNFMNLSTNYYVVLKPKQIIPKIVVNNNFFDEVKKSLIKYKIVGIIILIISFLYTILNILGSYHFKLLFEELDITSNNSLFTLFIVLSLIIVFKFIINLCRNKLVNDLNFLLDKTIIRKAFCHIINLPYLYYKNHTNGDLLTRINDLGNLKELISHFFVSVLVDVFLAIGIIIIMLMINVALSLIIIFTLILYGAIVIINFLLVKKDIRENYQKAGSVNNYLVEALASFETIKNLSLQKYVLGKFEYQYNEYNLHKKSILDRVNYEVFWKNSVLMIGNLLVMYAGICCIKDNQLTITSLVTFITLSNYLVEPIKNLLDLSIAFENTKESFRRIKEIYQIPDEDVLNSSKNEFIKLQGRIEINNVGYSYNGTDKVLDDFSLEIQEGQKVLICGASGSGKSTIIKLLIKYLDNNYTGNITVDGYDLKKINLNVLRKNICYTSQNEYLYTDSVYENITLGRKIKYQDFLDLAKNLFIDEIVKNSSLGYQYLIENNGENISGGERGRLLLARSLVDKYNIYIYDETFSAIDIDKERKILKYLFNKYQDKTFIIVSHRASNIDLFDQKIDFKGVVE